LLLTIQTNSLLLVGKKKRNSYTILKTAELLLILSLFLVSYSAQVLYSKQVPYSLNNANLLPVSFMET